MHAALQLQFRFFKLLNELVPFGLLHNKNGLVNKYLEENIVINLENGIIELIN